ncbi:mucin-22-like [Nilaparvata lugens]|uniref:mucin-22-like n=1 Tax=Nilaparvata lugens TaxID=108931 RepID=UPI00193DE09F|nr:mucin-22-like [Nilaparvata lugens]
MKVKKKEKIKRKQETIKNREWERERRGKLNVAFCQLDQLLPDYDPSRVRSKLAILMAAVGHITHLHQLMHTLSAGKGGATERDTVFASELARLHDRIDTLRRRCQQLAQLLQMADIPVPAPSNDKLATLPTGGKLATSQPHIKWNGNIAHKTVQQRIINSRKDKAEKKENNQLLEVGSTVASKNPPNSKTSSITEVSEDVEQPSTPSDSPELSPIKKVVDLCNTPLRELTGFTLNSACVLASSSTSPPPHTHPSSSPSSSISSPSSSLSSNSPLCPGEILETPVAKNDGQCLVGDAAIGEPGEMTSYVANETSDVTSSRNVVAMETNDMMSSRNMVAMETSDMTSSRNVVAMETKEMTSSRDVVAMETNDMMSSRNVVAMETSDMTSSRNVVAVETSDMTSSRNVVAMETKDMMSSSTENGQDPSKYPIGLDSGGGGKVCDQLATTSQSVTGNEDSSEVTDNPKSLVAVTPGTVADTRTTVAVTPSTAAVTSTSISSTSSLEAASKSIEVPLQPNSSQSNPAVAVTTPKVAATPSSSGLATSNSVEVPTQPNSSSGNSTVTEVQNKETSRAKSDNSQGKPATSAGNSSIPKPVTAKTVTVTTAGNSSNPIPATTKPVTVTTTGNTPNQIPVTGTVHVVNPYPSIMPVTVTNFGAPTVNQSIMIVLPDGRVVTVPQQQPQYVINQSVPHMINQSVPQIINHQSPTTIVIGNSAPVIEPIVFKAADRMAVNRAFEADGTTVNRAGKKGQQKRVLLSKCANKVPIPLVGTQFVVRRTVEMQVKASRVVEKRQRSRKVKKTVVSAESAKVKDVTKVAEFVEVPKTTQVENAKVDRVEEGLKPSDGKNTTNICRNKSVMNKVGMGEQETNKDKSVVKSNGRIEQDNGKKTEISRNESVLDKDGMNRKMNNDQTQSLEKSVVNNTSSVGALGNNNNSTSQRLENKSSPTKVLGGNTSSTEVLENNTSTTKVLESLRGPEALSANPDNMITARTETPGDSIELTDQDLDMTTLTDTGTGVEGSTSDKTSSVRIEEGESSKAIKEMDDSSRNLKLASGFKTVQGKSEDGGCNSVVVSSSTKLIDKNCSVEVSIGDKKKQEVVDSVKKVQEDKACSSMKVVVSDSRKQKVVEDFEKGNENQNQSLVAEQGTHPDVNKHDNVLNVGNNDDDDCNDHFGLDTMSDDNDDTENDGPIPSLLVDMPQIKRPADGSVMPPAKKLKTLDQQNLSDAPDKDSMHGHVFHQDNNSIMASVEGPVNNNIEDVQMITGSTDIPHQETPDPSCSQVEIRRQSNTNIGQKLELPTNRNCSSNYGVEKTVMYPNENKDCPVVNQQQGIASSVSNPVEMKLVGKRCEETVESTVLGIGNTLKNPVNHQPHLENVAKNKETLSDKCYTGNLVGQNITDNQTQLQKTNTSASMLLLPEAASDKLPDSYQTGNVSENNTVLDVQNSRMEHYLGSINQKGSQLLGFPDNSSHRDAIKDITPTSYPYISSVNPTNDNLALQKVSNFNISSTINTNMSYLSMTTNSARETVQSKNTEDDFGRNPSFSENGMIPSHVVNKVSGRLEENSTVAKETAVKMQTSNQNVKKNGDSFVEQH